LLKIDETLKQIVVKESQKSDINLRKYFFNLCQN
jgi:hypothetical protein